MCNKICENCNIEHDGSYATGRFCTKKCSKGFSTKSKRKEINEKVKAKLEKELVDRKCVNCDNIFKCKKYRKYKFCSSSCSSAFSWKQEEYRKNITNSTKDRCSKLDEKIRLREIGRKGGFGKKGYTDSGIYYQSNFEKQSIEYLESKNISFTPHKNIPNSSKVSDIYLNDKDIWIELDGINREKRQKWLGKDYDYWLEKLEIYNRENLKYQIIYNIEELKNYIETIY